MPGSRSTPSYRLHKQSGQAVVTLTDAALGTRRDHLLGRNDTQQSRAEYLRLLGEWEANGRQLLRTAPERVEVTVNKLVLMFWPHAEQHYRRPDGTITDEVDQYRRACRTLCHLLRRFLANSLPTAKFE